MRARGAGLLAELSTQTQPEARSEILTKYILSVVQQLGYTLTQGDYNTPFNSLGLGSLDIIGLANAIRAETSGKISPSDIIMYSTVSKLAGFLGTNIVPQHSAPSAQVPLVDLPSSPAKLTTVKPLLRFDVHSSPAKTPGKPRPLLMENPRVAIIGVACRLPQGIDSPSKFWEVLRVGGNIIGEVPIERWDISQYYDPKPTAPGKICSKKGAFLDNIAMFDPQFFNITSKHEVEQMDIQQRLLLEVCWEAFENAGIKPSALEGSNTGVYIGMTPSEYRQVIVQGNDPQHIDAYFCSGNAPSVAAGRISHTFNFTGPNMAVDTACSASFVALHQACKALHTGETGIALVGGVNIMLSPESSISFSKAGMLAPDGQCKTFDDSADGYARAEGCIVVVLKPLEVALNDGDTIWGVIAGSAINQDGHTQTLTTPSGASQEQVIQQALQNASVDPNQVSYFEAHGTGTPIGDSIEVSSFQKVMCVNRSPDNPILIGSVKSNVGHLEPASGLAGLLKVLLALQHEHIPPTINFNRVSQHIVLTGRPYAINTCLTHWPRNEVRKRIACISSFGFSGTNTHVVVEEPPVAAWIIEGKKKKKTNNNQIPRVTEENSTEPTFPYVVMLSAHTPVGLHDSVKQLMEHMRGMQVVTPHHLRNICATLAARTHLPHRCVIVAYTYEEVYMKLQKQLDELNNDEKMRKIQQNTGAATNPDKLAVLLSAAGGPPTNVVAAADMITSSPAFTRALERCMKILPPLPLENESNTNLTPHSGRSIPTLRSSRSTTTLRSSNSTTTLRSSNSTPRSSRRLLSSSNSNNVNSIPHAVKLLLEFNWGDPCSRAALYAFQHALLVLLSDLHVKPKFILHDLATYDNHGSAINMLEDGLRLVLELPISTPLSHTTAIDEDIRCMVVLKDKETIISLYDCKNLDSVEVLNQANNVCLLSGKLEHIKQIEAICKQHHILTRLFYSPHVPSLDFAKLQDNNKKFQVQSTQKIHGECCEPFRWVEKNGVRYLIDLSINSSWSSLCALCISTRDIEHALTGDHKYSVPNQTYVGRVVIKDDEWGGIFRILSLLYMCGADISWRNLCKYVHAAPMTVELPSYPFQRQPYWTISRTTTNQATALLPTTTTTEATEQPTTVPDLVALLKQQPPNTQNAVKRDLIYDYVTSLIVAELGEDPGADSNLLAMGFTSLMAASLAGKLGNATGKTVSLNVLYTTFTVAELADYVYELIYDEDQSSSFVPQSTELQQEQPAKNRDTVDGIAIIGMGCRVPGGQGRPTCRTIESYWEILKDGLDVTEEVPADRWNIDEYYDPDATSSGRMYVRKGGFLKDIGMFDKDLCGKISKEEAETMDPQQRILLETALDALDYANIPRQAMVGTRTGVYIGVIANDYCMLAVKENPEVADAMFFGTGCTVSACAGRISHSLGLVGPSMVVNTACSSSLNAVHLGCESLLRGEVDSVLAGGVNMLLIPDYHISFTKSRLVSPDGLSKAFDESANGYVRSEGCGIVVLKRHSDALRAGDNIIGIIRATGVNHNGSDGAMVSTSRKAQVDLMKDVLQKTSIRPSDVSYIEAHATGTQLGDRMEAFAINDVYGTARMPEHQLAIGSVKTNIGHAEAAAGVLSLIKVCLCITHEKIPANLHLHKVNPQLSAPLDMTPAVLPSSMVDWKRYDARKRYVAVSSFGFTGTNAHMIIEEPPLVKNYKHKDSETNNNTQEQHTLLLSARTRPALLAYVDQLLEHLRCVQVVEPTYLHDLCSTLSTRSRYTQHQLTITAKSFEDMYLKLRDQAILLRKDNEGNNIEGNSNSSTAIVSVDRHSYTKVDLPLYPLQQQYYWFPPKKGVAAALTVDSQYSLLQQNSAFADGLYYYYTVRLSPYDDSFWSHHTFHDVGVYPISCYLELIQECVRAVKATADYVEIYDFKIKGIVCIPNTDNGSDNDTAGDVGSGVTIQVEVEKPRLRAHTQPQLQVNVYIVGENSDGATTTTSRRIVASGKVCLKQQQQQQQAHKQLTDIMKTCTNSVNISNLHKCMTEKFRMVYGPTLLGLRSLYVDENNTTAFGEIALNSNSNNNGNNANYITHPTLLDGAVQCLLPLWMDLVNAKCTLATECRAYVVYDEKNYNIGFGSAVLQPDGTADMTLYNSDYDPIAKMVGVSGRPHTAEGLKSSIDFACKALSNSRGTNSSSDNTLANTTDRSDFERLFKIEIEKNREGVPIDYKASLGSQGLDSMDFIKLFNMANVHTIPPESSDMSANEVMDYLYNEVSTQKKANRNSAISGNKVKNGEGSNSILLPKVGRVITSYNTEHIAQQQPEQPVLLLLPGGGQSIFSLEPLVRELKELRQHTILAFEDPELFQEEKCVSKTIPKLASYYITTLRESYPHLLTQATPFILIGFSFGGFLAYEMTRQLLADGHRVLLLCVLDSMTSQPEHKVDIPQVLWQIVRDHGGSTHLSGSDVVSALASVANITLQDAKKFIKSMYAQIDHDQKIIQELASSQAPPLTNNSKLILFEATCTHPAFASWNAPHVWWRHRAEENAFSVVGIDVQHFGLLKNEHVLSNLKQLVMTSCRK